MTEQELLDKAYRKYSGKDIDVFFRLDTCQHSGVCVRGLNSVFDLDKKPWIQPDQATADAVTELIDRCPSGALQYIIKEK